MFPDIEVEFFVMPCDFRPPKQIQNIEGIVGNLMHFFLTLCE